MWSMLPANRARAGECVLLLSSTLAILRARPAPSLSRRDFVAKPRVARYELPWEHIKQSINPTGVATLDALRH